MLRGDDVSTVLAITETGTISGAGRKLGVSHATVFRRLAAIEDRLGVALFERSRTGYAPTAAGEVVADAGRRIEADIQAAERRIAGADLRLSGTVRVTTTDALFSELFSPILADFTSSHPDIHLEVTVSNRIYSLSRREADVALRPAEIPPEDTLVGRRIAVIGQAVYASVVNPPTEWANPDILWIGPERGMGYRSLEAWMDATGADARCRFRIDSVAGMSAAMAARAGVGVLPCYVGDADPRLVRISAPIPDLATDLWMLTHADLRRTARIRALFAAVASAVAMRKDALSGTGADDA